MTLRDEHEWIDVPDATPAIVDADLFAAVQARLDDPERLRQGRRQVSYPLHGRMKCSVCGASMVGQTLRGRFRYYRCRRAFAGPRHDRCESRYVRGELVEEAILEEAAAILAEPGLLRRQIERELGQPAQAAAADRMERRLASLDKQRERLLRLYQLGEVDEDYVARESAKIRTEQERLRPAVVTKATARPLPGPAQLDELCSALRAWLLDRGADDVELVAEALQLRVVAHADEADVAGEIPGEYAPACRDADVCSVVTKF